MCKHGSIVVMYKVTFGGEEQVYFNSKEDAIKYLTEKRLKHTTCNNHFGRGSIGKRVYRGWFRNYFHGITTYHA